MGLRAGEPTELLVLGGPANQLGLVAISRLERHLARVPDGPAGPVVVSHDRRVLDRVTTRMAELDGGHHVIHHVIHGGCHPPASSAWRAHVVRWSFTRPAAWRWE